MSGPGDNIVDASLTTADYKNNDIKSVDLANGGVNTADLADDAIPSDASCSFPGICFSSSKIADRAVGESEISPGARWGPRRPPTTRSPASTSPTTRSTAPTSTSRRWTRQRFRARPAFYAFDDDTGEICNVGCTELTLRRIPAGAYLILAKIRLLQAFDADPPSFTASSSRGADMATADTDLATFAISRR